MCISKHRLCDSITDCKYNDDEECAQINGSCLLYGLGDLFKCTTTNICISSALVEDRWYHCGRDKNFYCDDEDLNDLYIRKHISITNICDGFTELILVTTNGRNETDEPECKYWTCKNTYTRCDRFWNCFHGTDEVDCYSSHTNQFMCLPLVKANYSNIDCLDGTDEPKLCRSNLYQSSDNNF
ncbi:unnamed protein product [Rotaria sp. Silwood1]|nr:unnamed protein product [Rotaria sp. Silwood1]